METKKPSLKLALIGVCGVLAILLSCVLIFKIDVIIALTVSIVYVGILGRFNGVTLSGLIEGMQKGVSEALVGLLFFPLVGAIIGSWIIGGTIPALVYYGLNVLNPRFFLITSFLICSMLSLLIGTSWGTVGTVGLAIVGVAISSNLSIPIGVVAGSIISGAWFGDKMSPISDSTVLSATSAETDVYNHIRGMAYTTIPAFLISTVIFGIINFFYAGNATLNYDAIYPIQETLAANFKINILVFLPPVVLVVLCVMRTHAFISLLGAITAGAFCSVAVQGNSLMDTMSAIMNGVHMETAIAEVNTLVNRGGMNSMMSSMFLCLVAVCMGGTLTKTQFLHVIIENVAKYLRSNVALVFTTMVSCVLSNMMFADNYLSMILNGNLYRDLYDQRGLDRSMLSRTIEETATMTVPMIPWTPAAAFLTGTLGVTVAQYTPYCVLNFVSPVVGLLSAATGIGLLYVNGAKKKSRA